jgi:hypothetical protein
MMSNLSTLDVADVVAGMSEQQLRELAQLFVPLPPGLPQ